MTGMTGKLSRAAALLLALMFVSPVFAEFGVGGGVYYNQMLGSIEKGKWDIDEDYFSYLFSLKYQFGGFLGIEGLLDYYPGSKDIDYSIRPMATAVLGDFINAGAGINTTYIRFKNDAGDKKDEWSDMSYHFKAGLQVPVGGLLWLNADVYYFLDQLKDIQDFDKDYLAFGVRAHVRF